MKQTPLNKESGILYSPLVRKLTLITLITTITYVGSVYLSQYHKISLGRTCKHRMQTIEAAKQKFRAENPYSIPTKYSDLLPHLKFTGFPMCPWGGIYSNELSLTNKVECSVNGNPEKEPNTPRTNPKKNGYCDLEPEGKTITILTNIRTYLESLLPAK